MFKPLSRAGALALIAVLLSTAGLFAQDEYSAQTVPADPVSVSTHKLDIELKPKTRAELEVELAAWLGALKVQVEEITRDDIDVIEKEGEELQAASDAAFAARSVRDEIIHRVEVVAGAFEDKGGDVTEAEQYVSAVAGLPPITGFQATMVTAKAWLLSSEGGIQLGINIGMFLLILLVFKIVSRIVAGILDRALGRLKKTSDLLRSFLVNTTRKLIFFIGLVIAASYLGVDATPFVAAIGAVGFVVAFALQGTLGNFASGLMILIYRPYDIGDVVTTAGVTGKVDAMNLVSTTVKTPDNQTIVIPNGSIWGGIITNITANATRRVDMTFGIGYGDDIGKAKQALLDVCGKHELVIADPETIVEVGNLGESSVDLICRPWAATCDYWTVYWDLMRQVKERFDQEGISIPFPQRDLHVYQQPQEA